MIAPSHLLIQGAPQLFMELTLSSLREDHSHDCWPQILTFITQVIPPPVLEHHQNMTLWLKTSTHFLGPMASHKQGKQETLQSEAEASLMAEFAQLDQLEVYRVIDVNTLSTDKRKGALRCIDLIKEKRGGILKGRTVADGRPQKYMYDNS
jgi:hypothetical protein